MGNLTERIRALENAAQGHAADVEEVRQLFQRMCDLLDKLRSENDALRERMDALEQADVDAYKAAWAKTLKARRAAAELWRDASLGDIRQWHAGRCALYRDLIRDLENLF